MLPFLLKFEWDEFHVKYHFNTTLDIFLVYQFGSFILESSTSSIVFVCFYPYWFYRYWFYLTYCICLFLSTLARERPFNLKGWGGGYVFFSKKIFLFPMLLEKYSDFGGGKKK